MVEDDDEEEHQEGVGPQDVLRTCIHVSIDGREDCNEDVSGFLFPDLRYLLIWFSWHTFRTPLTSAGHGCRVPVMRRVRVRSFAKAFADPDQVLHAQLPSDIDSLSDDRACNFGL